MIRRLRDRLFGSGEASDGESGDSASVESGGSASGESGSSASDDGSIWDLTPDWQVGSYRLQGASISRDEQQQAVRDVNEQATELERELDDY